jgi:hypothetical protein
MAEWANLLSDRPTAIRADMTVGLSYPRDCNDPELVHLRLEILCILGPPAPKVVICPTEPGISNAARLSCDRYVTRGGTSAAAPVTPMGGRLWVCRRLRRPRSWLKPVGKTFLTYRISRGMFVLTGMIIGIVLPNKCARP